MKRRPNLPHNPTRLLRGCQLDEFAPAVLFPGGFIMTNHGGLAVPVTDRIKTVRLDAEPGEFFAQGEGAAFAERTIVFFGTALIAMTFDSHCGGRSALQLGGNG